MKTMNDFGSFFCGAVAVVWAISGLMCMISGDMVDGKLNFILALLFIILADPWEDD